MQRDSAPGERPNWHEEMEGAIANHGGPKELSDYTRDDLERFKLAAEVILRTGREGAIGDALEAELTILRTSGLRWMS